MHVAGQKKCAENHNLVFANSEYRGQDNCPHVLSSKQSWSSRAIPTNADNAGYWICGGWKSVFVAEGRRCRSSEVSWNVFPPRIAFTCFYRPSLEYCAQEWLPYLHRDAEKLEGVQKLATRIVTGPWNVLIEERLASLKLLFMEQRRQYGDLIA